MRTAITSRIGTTSRRQCPLPGPRTSASFGERWEGRYSKSGFRVTYDRLAANSQSISILTTRRVSLRHVTSTRTRLTCSKVSWDRSSPVSTHQFVRSSGSPGPSPDVVGISADGSVRRRPTHRSLAGPGNHDSVQLQLNVSYGREIGKGLSFEASYVAAGPATCWLRATSCSLTTFAIQSGLSYYDAVNAPRSVPLCNHEIIVDPDIPFFNNMFPFMPDCGEILR